MKLGIRVALLATAAACLFAQKLGHATWEFQVQPASAAPGAKVLIRAQARVEPGWHLYSASTPAGIPTSFQVGPPSIVERVRIWQPPPKRALDPNFGSDTETYDGEVAFLVELQIKKDAPVGPAGLWNEDAEAPSPSSPSGTDADDRSRRRRTTSPPWEVRSVPSWPTPPWASPRSSWPSRSRRTVRGSSAGE